MTTDDDVIAVTDDVTDEMVTYPPDDVTDESTPIMPDDFLNNSTDFEYTTDSYDEVMTHYES